MKTLCNTLVTRVCNWRLPLWVVFALVGVSPFRAAATELVYDVVSEGMITYDGVGVALKADQPDRGKMLLFPSDDNGKFGDGMQPIHKAQELLKPCNAIGTKEEIFLLKAASSTAVPPTPARTIRVKRPNKDSATLEFWADEESVKYLRMRSWEEFRKIQHDFERWLRKKGRGVLPPRSLLPEVKLFNHAPCAKADDKETGKLNLYNSCYEQSLFNFWKKVLAHADFATFAESHLHSAMGFEPDDKRIAKPDNGAGARFGAVPLSAGMRLAIHWGGTAVYNYNRLPLTRQTTMGTTYVEIAQKAGRTLFSGMVLGQPEADRAHLDVVPPANSGITSTVSDFLPFGDGKQRNDQRRVVPVQAEIDLYNKELFEPVAAATGGKYLTLLIPSEYTKADGFSRLKGTNIPETSDALAKGEKGSATRVAEIEEEKSRLEITRQELKAQQESLRKLNTDTDAMRATAAVELAKIDGSLSSLAVREQKLTEEHEEILRPTVPLPNWITALRRRFIVFCSKQRIEEPKDLPYLPEADGVTNWVGWDFLPAVFANQTTVDVEVPIRVNAQEPEWFLFGKTWAGMIAGRLAADLSRTDAPGCRVPLAIRRTVTCHSDPRQNHSRLLRFYTLQSAELSQIVIQPYDVFYTQP